MNNIYNAKIKTKLIFDLNCKTSDIPNENQVYYWITYNAQSDSLYANYKLHNSADVKTVSITNNGFLTDQNIKIDETTNKVILSVFGKNDLQIDIPQVYFKHIKSGSYSAEDKSLILNYNTGDNISIDMSSVVGTSNASIDSLLFKIPQIQSDTVLYFKIQFSETDDFTNIEKTINTAQAYGLEITQTEGVTIKNTIVIDNATKTINDIRIFSVQGTVGFPMNGLSDVFSGEQLTLNIKNIDKSLKYYRFQWSNDNGETFGKFGYGQTNGYINVFDDSCDVVKEQNETQTDYTAFEVMCRWETIYGEFSNGSYLGDLNKKTGYKYKQSLPCTTSIGEGFTEKFILRTATLQENQDVIVDWGDGTFSNVKNGDFESVSSSGFEYTMSHTYTQPSEFDKEVLDSNTTNGYRKTKRYIIKIYGKQYYGFKYTNLDRYNLMCRCLDWDLPVASHLTNFSSFCFCAKALQVVAVPEYTTYLKNAINFSYMFNGAEPHNCSNLISVTGFGKNDNDINYACNYMFNNCTNLIECDFILPNLNNGSIANVYNNCSSLNVDINSLIPKQGFLHKEINAENLFNSTAISGTVPANLLWNDSNITWKNTSSTFSNCSDEIRAQVPISWGGTASDDIINLTVDEKIDKLIGDINSLLDKINGEEV